MNMNSIAYYEQTGIPVKEWYLKMFRPIYENYQKWLLEEYLPKETAMIYYHQRIIEEKTNIA